MADITMDRSGRSVVAACNASSPFAQALLGELAKAGMEIVLFGHASRSHEKKAKNVSTKSRRESNRQSAEEVAAEVKNLVSAHEPLDGFIYFLDEEPAISLESLTDEEWARCIVSMDWMFLYYQAVSRQMAAQRHGSMVGVGFAVHARGDGQMLTWTVAGEAMVGMSKCLALELLKQNVRVNTVGYGYMEGVQYPQAALDALNEYSQYLGIHRRGTAKDVAASVRHLILDDTDYMTGQSVYVNGGLLI